jgi:serine/threonine protein kinase
MSPEQKQTAMADVRNDIYSLGVIFSQMNLSYDAIILRCQKPIESRYQNISELTEAIRRRDRRKTRLIGALLALSFIMLTFLVYIQSLRIKNVDDAIVNGKAVIDQAMQEAGVAQHLDTLQSIQYLRTDFADRLQDGSKAYQQYLKEIGGEFSESELAEISNALMIYDGDKTKQMVTRFNQLKEDYDKKIMQGN